MNVALPLECPAVPRALSGRAAIDTRLASLVVPFLLAASPAAGEGAAPPSRLSPHGHFVVTLLPPSPIPVQRIHAWQVKVATPSGEPVTGALVYLNGGMPEHGHGLPTRPKVTREPEPGTYRVEGMKFSMPGKWEILVAVQKLPDSDVTAFDVVVDSPPSR